MDGSGDVFRSIMLRLSHQLPDLADQIEDEVLVGRLVAGAKLRGLDRETRDQRMKEANLGRISQTDVVSLEFTDDQQVALLIDAIICAAETMQSSRTALVGLASMIEASPVVVFESPDGADAVEMNLHFEEEAASSVLEVVGSLLRSPLTELGGRP